MSTRWRSTAAGMAIAAVGAVALLLSNARSDQEQAGVSAPPEAFPPEPVESGSVRSEPRAAPSESRGSPEELTDEELARHARDEYGFDCPAIASREVPGYAQFEMTCTSGLRLRVFVVEGQKPRIGAAH